MQLSNLVSVKKYIAVFALAAICVTTLFLRGVFAADGPVIRNLNPQGTVTSSSVKLTLDTEDLAKCRYSKEDTSYNDMSDTFVTDDGLYHYAVLGSLSNGSYKYYVRCKDFEGNANSSSKEADFKVGQVNCVGDNCDTTPSIGGDTIPPVLSAFLPWGTITDPYITLSVNTSEASVCRYSWYDKSFDSMQYQFTSSDRLYHSAQGILSKYGTYVYYIRCRDDAGNVNATPGKITFRYPNPNPYVAPVAPAKPATPADATPPSISALAPFGDVDTATTTISCATDESATCKYGTTDAEYDSLTDVMDAASGNTSHSKNITLNSPGSYTYYVRCKDNAGNKNTASSQISFNYVVASKEGPVISGLQPNGKVILQKDVAFIAQTDKAADCRYSTSDVDFDEMQDSFDTTDGLLQQALVTLEDYGSYTYYVRCKDMEGNKDSRSEVINFEYKNPNPEETVSEPVETPATTTVTCDEEIKTGDKDGNCDKTKDCLCDPDCPASGDDADPDCANATPSSGSNNGWIVFLFIGLLLIIIVIIIIIIIKRRSDEEEVELP